MKSWEPGSVSGTHVLESKTRFWCNKWRKIQTLEVSETPQAYVPRGQTPPCLFHLLPPVFCTDLCAAAALRREETDLPISYYTTVRGLGAGQEDGIYQFQTPLAQNPALYGRQESTAHLFPARGCQGELPAMGRVQTPLFSHLPQSQPGTDRGVTLSRKSHIPPGTVIRTSRRADWLSPATGASLQAWDAQVRPAVTGLKTSLVLTPRVISFTAMLMDPFANQRTVASRFPVWKSWELGK